MAGNWIKMRVELPEVDEVMAIGSRLKIDVYAVVGRLHKLWSWADQHTVDGVPRLLTPGRIDYLVNCDGFAAAMAEVGWLDVREDGGVVFPHFEIHNGQSGKKRASNAQRQERRRGRGSQAAEESPACGDDEKVASATAVTQTRDDCHAASVTSALPTERETGERQKRKKPVTGKSVVSNSAKFSGSVFDDLTAGDLGSTAKLHAWFQRARARDPAFVPQDRWVYVRAAAFYAIDKADDPLAYFKTTVGRQEWGWITDELLDRAKVSIRATQTIAENVGNRLKRTARRQSRDRPTSGEPAAIGELLKIG